MTSDIGYNIDNDDIDNDDNDMSICRIKQDKLNIYEYIK